MFVKPVKVLRINECFDWLFQKIVDIQPQQMGNMGVIVPSSTTREKRTVPTSLGQAN